MNRATANNDHTVVSLACAGGHLAVVELLLAHGADPTHRLKVNLFLEGSFLSALCRTCSNHVVLWFTGWFNHVDRSGQRRPHQRGFLFVGLPQQHLVCPSPRPLPAHTPITRCLSGKSSSGTFLAQLSVAFES